MARLFSSGFEMQSAVAGIEWDAVYQGSGAFTIETATYFRSGLAAGKFTTTASAGYSYACKQIPELASGRTYYFKFNLYIGAKPDNYSTIFAFGTSAAGYFICRMTSTGALEMWHTSGAGAKIGNTSSALNTGQWYRIEVSYVYSTQVVTAKIDGGTPFCNNATTSNLGGNYVQFGAGMSPPDTGNGAIFYFDDIAINDDQGSYQNTWIGDTKIIHILPDSAGDNTQWTPSAGANYDCVNDYADADYVDQSTVNYLDDYNCAASGLTSSDTINLVAVGSRHRNSVASATMAYKLRIKKTTGGTVAQSSDIIPNDNVFQTHNTVAPRVYQLVTYLDPDSNAWTYTTLNSMQIGLNATVDSTRTIRISSLWALVDYTPAQTQTKTLTAKASIKKFSVTRTVTAKASIKIGGVTKIVTAKARIENWKRYWVGNGGNWNDTSRWAYSSNGTPGAPVPTSLTDVYFDAYSFTLTGQIINLDVSAICKDMDFTGVANTPQLAGVLGPNNSLEVYGNLKWVAGMTVYSSWNGSLIFSGSGGTHTIDFAGKFKNTVQSAKAILFGYNGTGSTWSLQSDINSNIGDVSFEKGTLNTNDYDITLGQSSVGAFLAVSATAKTLNLGSSTITVTRNNATAWQTSNLTLNAGTSTIVCVVKDSGSRTFYGGGLTYNNLTVSFQGTTFGGMTIDGSNTFNEFKVENLTTEPNSYNASVSFVSGTTQIVSSLTTNHPNFNPSQIHQNTYFKSVTAGSAATISKASGSVSVSFLAIKDITASGGAIPFVAHYSTNISGNTNWNFEDCTTVISAKAWIDGVSQIRRKIDASSDDAFEYIGSTKTTNSVNIRVGYRQDTGYPCTAGFRFNNVVIPQGSTVTGAYLRVYAYATESFSGVTTKVYAQDTDNATTFDTDTQSPEGKTPLTDANVSWSLETDWTVNTLYSSPDIKDVIQEIISRASWTSGNSLNLIIKNDSASNNHNISSYDNGSSHLYSAYLDIAFSGIQTVTKTTTAKASIRVVKSRTVLSKARIQISSNKTIQAKASIQFARTKSVFAKADIKVTQTKTIQAKSSIKVIQEKIIQAKSRIQIGGVTKTIQAKSNVRRTFSKTATAKSRIQITLTKTIQAKSHIRTTGMSCILAKADIQATQSKVVSAKSRIQLGSAKSISGKADIKKLSVTRIIQAKSRVQTSFSKILSAKSRIEVAKIWLVQAKSNIRITLGKTIQALAKITLGTVDRLVSAKARIQRALSATISAKTRIQLVSSKAIQAKSRIQITSNKSIQAKSDIQATKARQVSAKSRIAIGGKIITFTALASIEQLDIDKTIQAKADVKRTQQKQISAKGRIQRTESKTTSAKSNIRASFTKTIQAKSDIKVGVSKTVSAKANIELAEQTRTKTVDSKTRIQRTYTYWAFAKAEIHMFVEKFEVTTYKDEGATTADWDIESGTVKLPFS